MIAGSAAWYDGARGVAYMRRDPLDPKLRAVTIEKANYGRTGWGVLLAEHWVEGAYRGWDPKPAKRLEPGGYAKRVEKAKEQHRADRNRRSRNRTRREEKRARPGQESLEHFD